MLHGGITGDGAEGGGDLKRNLWSLEGVAETALFSIQVVIVEFLTKREQTSELYLFETWFFTDCVELSILSQQQQFVRKSGTQTTVGGLFQQAGCYGALSWG